MMNNSDAIKLALTASASSLLTYAVFRWHHQRRHDDVSIEYNSAVSPLREQAFENGDGSLYATDMKPRKRKDPYDPTARTG